MSRLGGKEWDEELTGALCGYMRKAAKSFFGQYGSPAEDELVSQGYFILRQGLRRFDPKRGSREGFCWALLMSGWRKKRKRQMREVPMGTWYEVLACQWVQPLSLDPPEGREEHEQRLHAFADTVLAADALCIQDDMATKLDVAKARALLEAMPADEAEPGRAVLLGMLRGKNMAEMARELGVARHLARSGVERVLKKLAAAMRDVEP